MTFYWIPGLEGIRRKRKPHIFLASFGKLKKEVFGRNKQTYSTTVASSIVVQHVFQHIAQNSVSEVYININFCFLKST